MLTIRRILGNPTWEAAVPRESIYIRLWFLLGLMLVGIVTGGYWFYGQHDAGVKERIVEQLHAVATIHVEDIQQWRQEQIADAQTALESLGYAVLPASNPSDAIRMARTYPGIIHLLLTDMIMPEMNGRQLAQAVQKDRSDIRYLFMSGYTQDVFSPDGKIDPDIPFIQKPFAVAVLSQKIREVMEKP